MRETLHAPEAPTPAGPYSHAAQPPAGAQLVYLSGQTPNDPVTGVVVDGDVSVQAERVFANLSAVLASTGLSLDDVVKVNVYLVDMADFPALNEVYRRTFTEPYPARTTVAVRALPLGARIEIEVVAARP
jgi:2-iminobutanoate/2-iminopropanoate deaminase